MPNAPATAAPSTLSEADLSRLLGLDQARAALRNPVDVAAERFAQDTAGHRMSVLLDTDDHLHLRFLNPKRGEYWYEVVTWPGVLAYSGDMGDFMFRWPGEQGSTLGFFHTVNPYYLSQKVVAGQVNEYSPEIADAYVRGEFFDAYRDSSDEQFRRDVEQGWPLRTVLEDVGFEDALRIALGEAHDRHDGAVFADAWEADLHEYTLQFAWGLHAIQHAFNAYQQHEAKG